MIFATTRRETLLGALVLSACAGRQDTTAFAELSPPDDERLGAIERRIGGRLGVAALNTADGAWLTQRAHERFAMCSTFKWLLAAQMLRLGEGAPDFLQQRVLFNESDLLSYAPATRARIRDTELGRMGEMSVEELCEAAVVLSDNTAANLLLDGGGGPAGLTQFLRSNGDGVTRLDRNEPELNENAPGDPRDTTTPDAMVRTMRRLLLGQVEIGGAPLNAASREKPIGWMVPCQTGRQRLRAGLPDDWRAGDKTGTGVNGAANDVAIAWPPARAPIVIACYMSGSAAPRDELNAAHAEVARIVAETWS